MIASAIEKIKNEMKVNNNTPYIQAIGTYVINNIEINLEVAKEIVEGKKTLKEALKKIEAAALKKVIERRGTQCVVMSPEEVFSVVDIYYEFKAIQSKKEVEPGKASRDVKKALQEKKRFNVDLNSLLGR